MTSYIEDILMNRCPEALNEINGVKFTSRQIDILSCFLNGKDPKAIANLLSISQKTVESHGENMRQRAGRFSRQHLISFVEESGKTLLLKKYYLTLCGKIHFEKTLQKISTIEKEKKKVLVLNPEASNSPGNDFSELLITHLKKSGLEIIVQKKLDLRKLKKENTLLILFSKNFYPFREDKSLERTLTYLVEKNIQTPESVILLVLDEEGKSFISKLLKQKAQIFFEDREHYFASFLDLLKYLFPQSEELKEIIAKFHRDYSCLWELAQKINNQLNRTNKILDPLLYLKNLSESKKLLFPKFIFMIRSFIVLLLCTLGGIFIFLNQNSKKLENSITRKSFLKTDQQEIIRSDLPLPHESALLKRPHILKTMDKKLKTQEGIQTIALIGVVGIGGAGKTTLARQYARSRKEAIVWEINAETKENLINSFEDLAHATAKTQEEHEELCFLREIKNPEEREKRLFLLVKKKLRVSASWLLIYDNVDTFSDIKGYFPSDPNVWGTGKVIITTRDKNIKNNAFLNSNSVIDVQILNSYEQYILFKNILYGKSIKITPKWKKEIKEFLKKLPPFPLDISTTAYYIKNTKISFEEYLKRAKALNENFEKAKSIFLEEMTGCAKTRYGIIALTLQRLIKVQPEFEELLLFISLLDSQNIPIKLLKKFKSALIVEQFIHHLRKHSFINIRSIEKNITISLHRSTQALILAFFKKQRIKNWNKQKLEEIASMLGNYMKNIMETGYTLKIRILITHGEFFLNQHKFLGDFNASIVGMQLALLYNYLGNFQKGKEYLKKSLHVYEKHKSNNQFRIALTSVQLGKVYRDLGKFEKAKLFLEKGYTIFVKLYGKKNIYTAWSLVHLGNISRSLGKYKKANKLLENAYSLYREHFSNKHIKTAQVAVYFGSSCRYLGKYKKAKELFEKAYIIHSDHFGTTHYKTAWVITHLGNVYRELGSYLKAKHLLEQGLIALKKQYGKTHIITAWNLSHLGRVYLDLAEYQKAEKTFIRVHSIYNKQYGKTHIRTAWALTQLARTNRALKNYQKAKEFFEQAYAVYKKQHTDAHIRIAWIFLLLGNIYRDLNDFVKANQKYQYTKNNFKKYYGDKHLNVAEVLYEFGKLNLRKRKLKKAENQFKESLYIYEKHKHVNSYICF